MSRFDAPRSLAAPVALLFAIGLTLGGCASTVGGVPVPTAPNPVTPTSVPGGGATGAPGHVSIDGSWQLASGTDSHGAMTVGSDVVTLKIDGSDSGGKAPCNAYGMHFSSDVTGPIVVTPGVHTDMACSDPDRNILEMRYLKALDQTTTTALEQGDLVLSGTDASLRFTRLG